VLAGRVGEGLGGRAEKVFEVAIGQRERERGGGWGIFFFCFFKRERGWGTLEVKKNLNLTLEAVGEAVGERVFK
jgi:hypothetical protein